MTNCNFIPNIISVEYRDDTVATHDVPTMSPRYEYDRISVSALDSNNNTGNQQSQDDKMVLSQTEFVELQNGKVIESCTIISTLY
jgi:hypothetical protein